MRMNIYYILLISMCVTSIYAADETQGGFDLAKVSVELLKDHPGHIDVLCKMWHESGGYKSYPNFDEVREGYTNLLKNQMRSDELPLALIALFQGEPIGLCALRPTCIPRAGAVPWSDDNPDKKPWLAIYVAAALQKRGVGKKLVQETVRYAHTKFGFDRAYVVPENDEVEALYRRKGCVKIADTTLRGKPAPVLEIEFKNIAC